MRLLYSVYSLPLVRRLAVLWLLVALAAPARAAVRRQTHDDRADDYPQVNGSGQVIWLTGVQGGWALEFWDGAAVRQLATGVDLRAQPQISESGRVIWQTGQGADELLLLWDGNQTRTLFRGSPLGLQWHMNPAGQVVWQGADSKGMQVSLWDGTSVRQLSHLTGDSINPQINRAGQVVWESQGHVYLWDGQAVRELTVPGHIAFSPLYPQINDAGWVVWLGIDDPNRNPGFSLWDGTSVRRITDTPEWMLQNLRLSNAGTVTFEVQPFLPPSWQLYVWDGTSSRLLAQNHSRYEMNRPGQIVWDTNGELFLWDGTAVRSLGQTGINYPEYQINDAGEVVWQVSNGTAVGSNIARWDGHSTEVISRTPEDEDPGIYQKRGLQLGANGHVGWAADVLQASREIFLYSPPAPGSLELELPELIGGRTTTGRVTLPEPAPPGGAQVQLASAKPAVAAVPPSVTVPAGMTMATFPVTTFPVRPSATVTLSASYGGQTWTAMLTVDRVGIDLPGGITQLTMPRSSNSSPRLNDQGQVAWLSQPQLQPDQIVFWTGGPIPTLLPIVLDHAGAPTALNNAGEVLWELTGGEIADTMLYLWDGRAAQPFAPIGTLGGAEQINDQGQIAWQTWVFDTPSNQFLATLWFWDGQNRRKLAQHPNESFDPSLNNQGHLVWSDRDGSTDQVFFWDGATIHELTHGPLAHAPLQLNDRDQVLWTEWDATGNPTLVFWDGSAEHRLGSYPFDRRSPFRLNNQGWVVWQDDNKIELWDGAAVRQINDAAGFPGDSPALNDAGEVAWVGAMGQIRQTFLWHDGVSAPITQDEANKQDLQLNNAGQVVWTGGDVQAPQIYLYTPPLALTVSPAPLIAGYPATGTVTLTASPASLMPAGGTTVQLASQSPALTVPPSVTIPAGQTSATFPITTAASAAPSRVILTASTANAYRPAVLMLMPPGLSVQPDRVMGGQPATGTIALPPLAPAGGAVVTLASDSAAVTVPATVTVPAGQGIATFPITTVPVSRAATVHLTATSSGTQWTATLMVLPPPVLAVAVDPSPVSGGQPATGTVTLASPAPAGGAVVTLTSDHSDAAFVSPTVTVPAGATQTTFPIRTFPVNQETAARIAASTGERTETAILTVLPVRLASISVPPDPIAEPGDPPPPLTITLSGQAPAEGALIQLSTDHPSLISFPEARLYAGQTSGTVPLTVYGVDVPTDVVITARFAGVSATTTLHLVPFLIGSVQLSPDHVAGGQTVQGTVSLSGAPEPAGTVVQLSSDHPEIVMVPAQVTITNRAPAMALFTVKTARPAQDTVVQITAAAGGRSRSASLTVFAVALASLTMGPSPVLGGNPATGVVTLSAPAPPGGALVQLGNNHNAGATAPDSVSVPAGALQATFPIQTQPVTYSTYFEVTAAYGGESYDASLQIVPLSAAGLGLQPAGLTGGESVTAIVTLNFPSPSPAGATVTLSSDHPQVASVPNTVTVPAGAMQASFPISTQPVSTDTRVNITAALGGQTAAAMLYVQAPRLAALTLDPAVIPGGGFVVGRVTLTGPAAAAGIAVTLASGDPNRASVPDHVDIPPGAREAIFPVTTSATTAPASIPIAAALGDALQSADLIVLSSPAAPATFTVSVIPASITGGKPVQGAIALAGPAPAGGLVVTLAADHPALVTVPAQVTVPAGASAVLFPIETQAVTAPTSISISGTSGGEVETALLQLLP